MSRVYFFQATGGGPIKIGYSIDLEARKGSLTGSHPQGITVLASLPGNMMREAFFHRLLADYRMVGEWFRSEPPVWRLLLEIIERGEPAWIPNYDMPPKGLESRARNEADFARGIEIYGSLAALAKAAGSVPSHVHSLRNQHYPAPLLWATVALAQADVPTYLRRPSAQAVAA